MSAGRTANFLCQLLGHRMDDGDRPSGVRICRRRTCQVWTEQRSRPGDSS